MHPRKHAVLVPGFAGFDALGQLRYYVGVTGLFRAGPHGSGGTLHYFDNFPTASVSLRAKKLREFLAKKVVRGEIRRGDEVTLIGHSTGGLDIRATMAELTGFAQRLRGEKDAAAITRADGCEVPNEEILQSIRRLVFISVPHYGTNLADYLTKFQPTVQGLIKDLGLGLRLNRDWVVDLRQRLVVPLQSTESDLLRAIYDSLNESDLRVTDEAHMADERDARSELAHWLEHMGENFDAFLDLRSATRAIETGPQPPKSPAHFDGKQRLAELASWPQGLTSRSYATRVPRDATPRTEQLQSLAHVAGWTAGPLGKLWYTPLDRAESSWLLGPLSGVFELARASGDLLPLLATLLSVHRAPWLPFELAYALCADPFGPFAPPGDATAVPSATLFGTSTVVSRRKLARGDNDGIVNTLSMLWPHDSKAPERHTTVLIDADHADVIGHYRLCPTPDEVRKHRDRLNDAYDLLVSDAGFDRVRFEALWGDIFAFAFGP